MKNLLELVGIDFNFLVTNRFWDVTYFDWILFGIFIAAAFLLKKIIVLIISKVFSQLFKKWLNEDYSDIIYKQVSKPLGAFVQIILFYSAFEQLSYKLDRVFLVKNAKDLAKEIKIEQIKELNYLSVYEVGEKIFLILIVYFFFNLVIKFISLVIQIRLLRAQRIDDRARQQILPLLKDVSRVILWFIAIATMLSILFNIKFATLLGGLGIGGVAIAFAAKESLENLIASFMVLVDKPFTIGDWIKIDGTEGIIEKVGFRSSRLRTFDKSIVIIPNRKLIDSNLENFSHRGIRRLKFTIGGIYGISQENFELAIKEMEAGIPKVEGVQDEGTKVWFDMFGNSQLNLEVMYFIKVDPEVDYFDVKHQVNFLIYKIMYKYCQGFAFPSQTEYQGAEINQIFPSQEIVPKQNNDPNQKKSQIQSE